MTAEPIEGEFGVFQFGLSDEAEARARALHADSIVIDMLFQGPCGYRSFDKLPPFKRTGDPVADLFAVEYMPERMAVDGEFSEFRDCWVRSGITGGNRQAGFSAPYAAGFSLAQAQFDRLPWLTKAIEAADFRRAKTEGKVAGFITTQNTEGLDPGLQQLQIAYDLGMRMIGLTYNNQNMVGGGCTDRRDGGVSNFGAKLIARMDELGIIVDTSHSGRQTTLDACVLSERPVVASHTSAAGVFEVDRAKSDEEIQAIAETGGVIGVYAVPFFLAPSQVVTIEAMLDHVDYISGLVGWQHVGIGTDWPLQADRQSLEDLFLPMLPDIGFGPEHKIGLQNVVGFDDYRDFPNIARGLVSRGYDDDQVRGILGENFLRVFQRVCG